MHKTLRFAIVFAYLFTVAAWGPASARASASALTLNVSPSQFYVYDVENFVTVSGAALGTVSTVVTYTLGATVVTVEPQHDPDNPVPAVDVWVPFEVSNTVGQWEVRVLATGFEGLTTTYGPASLDIIERQEVEQPPSLPEVLVIEAGVDTFTYDAGNATCDVESGSTLSFGTTRVTCTFGGVNYWFDAVLTDATPPVVTVPENIDTLNHTVTFTVSAIDNLDGPLTPACSHASGSEFPDGETLVQCVVQDSFANEAGAFFLITVGPPVFHLSGDSTTEATEPGGAVVTYDATVGNGTINCSPASGALFPVATTTVNCSAQNAVASSTTAFFVSVVDTTAPSLILPGDFTANSTNPGGVAVNYTTQSTDIVSGAIAVLCSTPSGSTFPVGTTFVECSATDAHNNSTTGSFNLTVVYNPPPTPVLTDAGARVWLGLKDNSNPGKKNTTFDLLVEVLLNGTVVGSGQSDGVGGGPGFGNAVLRSVALAVGSTPISPGDIIGVRVSVRIAANSASSSATARMWINDAGANSSVNVVIQGETTTYTNYFLGGGAVLGAVGSGPKIGIDVDVDRNVDGNAFKPFGVWTVQY